MANGTPLEDVTTKTPEETGVFASIKNTFNKVADFTDKAADVGADFLEGTIGTAWDATKDTFSAAKNIVSAINPFDDKESKFSLDGGGILDRQVDKQKFNDFELKQAEKLNNISGWTQAKDIVGTLGGVAVDWFKEKTGTDDLSKSLKIDKGVFNSTIEVYNQDLTGIDSQIQSIGSKYQTLQTFNNNVYQQYLKDKNITGISDQADFELYKQKELARLNGIEQSRIIQEQNGFMSEISQLEQQKIQKQEELRGYLNENIITDEGKTGEQVYNEIQEKQTKETTDREYINTIGEIYNYSKEQVEDKFEAMGLAQNSTMPGYDTFKDAIIDDVAAENQYMMSIKGMKDLPNYEALADQAKVITNSSFNFKTDFAKRYLDMRNNPENKGMSEVDLRNKAVKEAWDALPTADKINYKDKERFVTEVAVLRNRKQGIDRIKTLNPLAIKDFTEAIVTIGQSLIDQAYDFETDDVPHYVKQDTRNIIYAGEGIGKNIASMITYNPDTLLSIALPSIGGKKIDTAIDAVKTAANSNKIVTGTLKIGYGNATTRFLGKAVANVTSSQMYGAIGDAVMDNVMMEAPTKAADAFNTLSNVLFDTTPFAFKSAFFGIGVEDSLKAGPRMTSMNRLAYEFLDKPTKESVQNFALAFGEKTGKKIGIGEAKTILDEGVNKFYRTTYNPFEYKDLMLTNNKLYDFIGEQLNGLSKDSANEVLTHKGIAFSYKQIGNELGLSYAEQYDITDAFNKINSPDIDPLKKQMEQVKFNNLLKDKMDSLTPGVGSLGGIKILKDKVNANEIEFNTLVKRAKSDIEFLKIAKTTEEFTEYLSKVNSSIKDVQGKFSNMKSEIYIKMKNVVDGTVTEMRIGKLADLSDKNIIDIFKEGKVKFTKGEFENKEFEIVDTKKDLLIEKFNKHIFQYKSNIEDLEKELNLIKGTSEGYKGSNTIEGTIQKMINGQSSKINMPWIKDEEQLDKVAILINKVVGDFVGSDYIGKEPININKSLKAKPPKNGKNYINEKGVASGEDILELISNDDSFINVSYGHFTGVDGKEVFLTYLMPGKQLLKTNEILHGALNIIKADGKINATALKNQGGKIIGSILGYSILKNGKVDIKSGILKTIAEYSAKNTDGLFDESGVLNEIAVKKEIHKVLSSIYKDSKDVNMTVEFITEAVKSLDKSQELIIKPIIYNLAYQYINNKPLIDAMIKKGSKFEGAFVDILLSKELRNNIADRIKLPLNEIPSEIVEYVSNSMNKYYKQLDNRKTKLEADLKQLEEYEKFLPEEQLGFLLEEKETLNNRIKSISNQLSKKVSTTNKEIDKFTRNNLFNFITSKSKQVGGEILGTSYAFLKDNIEIKNISSQEDLLKLSKATIKNIQDLNKKDIDKLGKLVDDVIANVGNTKRIEEIRNGVKDVKIQKTLDKIIKLSTEADVPTVLKDLHTIGLDDAMKGVLQYEYAISNNPLKKSLQAVFNNSNTGIDKDIEELFLKNFLGDSEGKTYNDIIEADTFKKFLDDINNINGNNKKEIKKSARKARDIFNKEIEKIFSGYSVIARKDGVRVDILQELIKDMKYDGKLFQNIKNIKNKTTEIVGSDNIGSIVKKIGDNFHQLKKGEKAFIEVPLQMQNMFETIKTGDEARVKYLAGWNNKYVQSIINVSYLFNGALKINDYKTFLKQSPIEGLIMLKEWFNGKNKTTTFKLGEGAGYKMLQKLKEDLGDDILKLREEGYAFVGGVGDKDSLMHLYKAPKEILDLCTEKNYASEIYNVAEYAYSNGYLSKDRILKTHDDFLKSFVEYSKDALKHLKQEQLTGKQMFDIFNKFIGIDETDLSKYKTGVISRLGNGTIGIIKLSDDEIQYLGEQGIKQIARVDLYEQLKKFVDTKRAEELKLISQNDSISIKDIRKREAFNASVRKTFGEIKLDTNTYVIKKLLLDVPKAYKKFEKIKLQDLSDNDINDLTEELLRINDDDLGIKESITYLKGVSESNRDFLESVKTTLGNGFYNDMQDGTAFATKDLFDIRAAVNGINLKDEHIREAYKQFKDHFYGEVDGVRFGGKALFNEGVIKDELGEEISNAVVIGKSSVKLGKDLIDESEEHIITINGRRYIANKVKGTDTSFFKNASSDSLNFKDDVSFSSSIIASFSKENIKRLTKLQKAKMQEAFDKHLKGLLEIDFKTGALSSVDIALLKNISETGIGYSSNSYIGSKLEAFMNEIIEVMNKPQEKGQSMFIYESNATIKPNEVIMHPNSETVKVIREDVAMAKFGKEFSKLSDKQKLIVDDNLFTVGYRYPVPSTYNMGTYKIKFSTTYTEKVFDEKTGKYVEINPYDNMGTEQVVSHPLATYMKLEGDNDGDHLVFISAFSDFGKICTNETNGVKIDGNFLENIKKKYDDKDLGLKFLALKQVDKDKGGAIQTLADSRLAALGAKNYIGNVSATIRSIKNLVYSKGTGIPIPKNQKKGFFDEYYGESMEDLKYDYLNLDGITELEKLNIDDRKFASIAAQLLQETLDFGNSGKSKFDPDWYAKLLKAAGIEEKDVDIVQSLYITPLSISYNQDMNRYNIPSIFKKTDKKTDINTKYFYNIVGAKRDLISFLGEIKSGDLTLPDILRAFNMPYDFTYILNKYKNYFSKIEDETMSGRLRQIYNDHFRLGQMGDKDRFVRKSFTSDKVKFSVPTLEQIDEMGDLVFKAKKIGYNYGLLYKGKKLTIGAFEQLYHTLKGTELFDDAIKYLGEKNARDKRIIGNELFDNIKKLQKNNPAQAYNIGMLLYTGGEKKIINFLNEDDYIKFLNESDLAFANTRIKDNIRIKDLFKEIGVTIPEKQVDKIVDATDRFTDVISELQSEIDKAVQENKLDDLPVLQSALVKTQDDKVLLEQKIKELTSAQETKVDLINQYKAEKESIDLNDFYIPEFDHKLIDVDGNAVNYLFDEATGFAEKTRNGLNAKIIKFFERYVPQFTRDHTFINDMLGINNKSIKEAFDFTQLHFNEYRKYQKGIVMKLKNAGIEKYIDIARKIQYSMLDNIDGKYIARDNESMLKLIKTHLGTYGNLINDKEFTDALFDYRDGAITKISDVLNELTAVGYKVADHYKGGEAFSLVLDTLEAHKGDTQLALRLNGFLSKDQFRLHLIDKMGELGEMDGVFKRKISNGTVNLMLEVLYGGQSKGREKIFGGLQSIHYDMNYGKMSLVTGNGIMSGIAQMLPNYVELMSYMRKNLTDIAEGYKAIKVLGILDSESTIQYGSSIGKDFTEYGYLDGTIEKALSLIGVKSIKGNHAVAVLHAILTNPLGGTDYSIETLRKMVATVNTMKKLKIKNADELEKNIVKYGRDYEAAVKHEARKAFAESGGGVNSSSALYKDTVFNHLHNYVDIWGVRFATKSFGYLMNWSYNKAATLIEKEGALGYAVKDLINGNYRSAKAHFDDFMVYNSMIAHQSMLAMGLYMKMEKYEKNNNDRVSFSDFRDTFSNSVVALGILLDKHLAAWESAKDAGGDFNDRLGYTTVGLIRHTFRLFGQANFVATMYKHYMYTQAEGKGDLFNSLQYAMKQHYSSYIKYTGMEQMDNIYGTLDTNAKLGLLGTGAQTDTEKAFEDLSNGNYFGIYKNKGFIKALVDMFPSLLSKNFTSTPAALQSLISKDLIKTVMEDKELSQLIRGGGFGMGKGEYNIEQLFGKIGSTLDNEQYNSVLDIYKQLSDYNYNYLKTTGIKEDSYTQSTADRVLHEMIDKALVKEGYNIKDLIAQSGLTPEMTKTLAVLETKHGFKTPLVISLLIENEYNAKVKELKETQGKLTGQISAYGTVYKDLAEEDKMGLKRDLLVKYQQYFNLNRQLGMDVISTAITMKHGDKLDEIQKNFKGNSGKDMLDFMQKSFVIGQVAKSGDTSVSKLHSRYALAAKGLGANDTTTVIVNNFLHKLFANDNLNHKEKLANAAGFLSGLDKATYGMLTNNEEFNKLTDESKKVLANWIYKINSESIDYDSNSLLNQLNGKSYGGSGSSKAYFKLLYPKYKSGSFEGARPNYSKQFAPIQKMIPTVARYIDKDNNGYLRGTNPYGHTEGVYNNLKNPYMKQYKDLLIEQLFYGYKSKGIIKPVYASDKVDKTYKKNINIKKAKSVKQEKTFTKPKAYKKHTRNLFINSPLATYGGE